MMRSSQPPSNTAARAPGAEDDPATSPLGGDVPRPHHRRRLSSRLASPVRWLHTYLSMFAFAALLFFGLTGITLNHPRLFYDGVATSVDSESRLDADWVKRAGPGSDPELGVKKLEVVEHLRQAHGLQGALASFTTDEEECVVTFKGPGYSADAFIRRADGNYRVTEERLGVVAVMNDLHKGRDTGPIWSAVVDLSAGLTALASVTGLLLLFYIKRRRALGLMTALVGAVLLAAAFVLGVQ